MNILLSITLLLTLSCADKRTDTSQGVERPTEGVNKLMRRMLTTFQYPLDVEELTGTCDDAEYEFARLFSDAMGICTMAVSKITPPVYCRKASGSDGCFYQTPGLTTKYYDSCCVNEETCRNEIMNQWVGLFSGLATMWTLDPWGMGPSAPTLGAKLTAKVFELTASAGLSVGEQLLGRSEAEILLPFARTKLAYKQIWRDTEQQNLLMEVAQAYLDQGLATGQAYEHWNVYPAPTRETILATACRVASDNALRGDESLDKLRRYFEDSAHSFNDPGASEMGVEDCLNIGSGATSESKTHCAKLLLGTVSMIDPTGISTIMNAFTYETCPNVLDPNDSTYNPRTPLHDDHPWHKIQGQVMNQVRNTWNNPSTVNDRGDGDSIKTQLKALMLPEQCTQYAKGVCRPQVNFVWSNGENILPYYTRSLIALDGASLTQDHCCPANYREVSTELECLYAFHELDIPWATWGSGVTDNTRAHGCLLDIQTDTVHFNYAEDPSEIRGMDEVLCVRGVGARGKGFVQMREIPGYRMGERGSLCPGDSRVMYQSDCEHALQQFTDNPNVNVITVGTESSGIAAVPTGCSYNVGGDFGVWNSPVNVDISRGTASDLIEPICYNRDEVVVDPIQKHCDYQERKMWDNGCCGWGISKCPSGWGNLGKEASGARMYRKCYRNVCTCPSDTRTFQPHSVQGHQVSALCIDNESKFHQTEKASCYASGHDEVSRDDNCPGAMWCDSETKTCQLPIAMDTILRRAHNTARVGLCTCPSGAVFGVGSRSDGALACHGGIATEIVSGHVGDVHDVVCGFDSTVSVVPQEEVCNGDFLAYCNAYPDLQNAICGGNWCTTSAQAMRCRRHAKTQGVPNEGRNQCSATCDGDYLAYCNAYPDLRNAFCGGSWCTTSAQAIRCERHAEGHGVPNEGRDQCRGSICGGDYLAYCNEHSDLQETLCGGQCTTIDHALACKNHWNIWGFKERYNVCDHGNGFSVATTACVGNTMEIEVTDGDCTSACASNDQCSGFELDSTNSCTFYSEIDSFDPNNYNACYFKHE